LQTLTDVRVLLATFAVAAAGCSLEHGVAPGGGGGGSAQDPTTPDAPVTTTARCRYADPQLRLCVEFDDGNYSTATDGSPYQFNLITSELLQAMRGSSPAAGTYWQSKLAVPESPMLDISSAITFETWVAVTNFTGYHNGKLISNQNQYEIALDSEGRVTCTAGSLSARSDTPIGREAWKHIACVYDGTKLAVWVNGAIAKCQTGSTTIPTAGDAGTRLVNGFYGFIDDQRVYARALTDAEICTHADKTGCSSACP
jgi:hypothetical protein